MLCKKVGRIKRPDRADITRDFSFQQVRKGIEESLRRLRTDYIDFYHLHGDPVEEQIADTLAELAKLRDAGKIRFYGISSGDVEKLKQLHRAGGHVAQVGFSLLNQAEKSAIDWRRQAGVAVLIRTPRAWGAAFARYAREEPPEFERGDNRHGAQRADIVSKHERGLAFSFLWEGTGRSPAQAALRHVLDQPGVSAVIPGTKRIEHLEDNVQAAAVTPLSAEEMDRVGALHRTPPDA